MKMDYKRRLAIVQMAEFLAESQARADYFYAKACNETPGEKRREYVAKVRRADRAAYRQRKSLYRLLGL